VAVQRAGGNLADLAEAAEQVLWRYEEEGDWGRKWLSIASVPQCGLFKGAAGIVGTDLPRHDCGNVCAVSGDRGSKSRAIMGDGSTGNRRSYRNRRIVRS